MIRTALMEALLLFQRFGALGRTVAHVAEGSPNLVGENISCRIGPFSCSAVESSQPSLVLQVSSDR